MFPSIVGRFGNASKAMACSARHRQSLTNQLCGNSWGFVPHRSLGPFGPQVSCYSKGVFAMSRKLLSLAMLAAAFTLVVGTTDAQARHCRSHHSHRGGCQTSNYGTCGNQQTANVGCQQASHVTTNACCNPRPTCCGAQPAYGTSVIPASFSAPQPPVELGAPAPAPGN